MRCAGQLSQRDFVSASFLHLKPRRFFTVLGVLLLGATLAAEALLIRDWWRGREWTWPLVGLSSSILVLLAHFFWYVPWRARKTFRLLKGAVVPKRFFASTDEIDAFRKLLTEHHGPAA